ncbi:MAG TPA: helix-turn-helix domain-containing protein, partial [Vicinamibacteria bacterium]|nr:helix-turn-helix domain-containing protein [Vicinamibacteria bacterium]
MIRDASPEERARRAFFELTRVVKEAALEDLPAILGRLAEVEATVRLRLSRAEERSGEDTNNPPERLLSLPEVACNLGITEDRAYDLARQHRLPVVTIGKYKRVRASALAAFVASNEEP